MGMVDWLINLDRASSVFWTTWKTSAWMFLTRARFWRDSVKSVRIVHSSARTSCRSSKSAAVNDSCPKATADASKTKQGPQRKGAKS